MFQLFATIAIALVILYLPGFMLLRSLCFSSIVALAAAPIVSGCFYAAIPLVYYEAGIFASFPSVFLATLVMCLGAYALSLRVLPKRRERIALAEYPRIEIGGFGIPFEWAILVFYVLVGFVVCWYMIGVNLSSADVIYGRYDNQTHVNLARAFLDSGKWSSLHTSIYLASPENTIPITKAPSFYPSQWAVLVAMICSATGQGVGVCSNALNIALISVVYPGGMFLLVSALFPRKRLVAAAGAVIALALSAFPWQFFFRGPLYPNCLSIILMIQFLALVVIVAEGGISRRRAAVLAAVCVMSVVSLALAQPNTVFTAFLFITAYACHYAWHSLRRSEQIQDGKRTAFAVLVVFAICLCSLAVWVGCLNAPFLSGVLNYPTNSVDSLAGAAFRMLTLWLGARAAKNTNPDFIVALVSLVGIICCLKEKRFWILAPVGLTAVSYLACHVPDTAVCRFFAGFWYSDVARLSAIYMVLLVPVASLGFARTARFPVTLYRRLKGSEGRYSKGQAIAVMCLAVALSIGCYIPSIPGVSGKFAVTGIGKNRHQLHNAFSSGGVYSSVERDFVARALEEIPDGALVLNQPNDGSSFAYATNGMNVYIRRAPAKNMKDESTIIAQRLADYKNDPEVQEVLRSTGARYLIMLDQGVSFEDGTWLRQYTSTAHDAWRGVNSVTDDTPGFTVVLADGDMRLYRIG